MSIISKPYYTFGVNACIGCGKPLNSWNKHHYHNRKCFLKWYKALDERINLKAIYESGRSIKVTKEEFIRKAPTKGKK